MTTLPFGYAEFSEDGSSLKDKIVIHDENIDGQLKVEHKVRVPKDPRGFKVVVLKSGTWTSSAPEKQKPSTGLTKENYDEIVRKYSSATALNFDGESSAAVSFSKDDQDRDCFTYGGKKFVLTGVIVTHAVDQ